MSYSWENARLSRIWRHLANNMSLGPFLVPLSMLRPCYLCCLLAFAGWNAKTQALAYDQVFMAAHPDAKGEVGAASTVEMFRRSNLPTKQLRQVSFGGPNRLVTSAPPRGRSETDHYALLGAHFLRFSLPQYCVIDWCG